MIEKIIKNKIMGCILLISGTAIGAGMLALPLITARNGFFPSVFTFFICWFFMTIAALLLVEVNLRFTEEKDLISMVGATLGNYGKIVASFAYLLLLYSLICAYLQGTNAWLIQILKELDINYSPIWVTIFLILACSTIVFYGTKVVEYINRYLVFGLMLSYAILIISTLPRVELAKIAFANPSEVSRTFPLIITAFGFSVIMPSITTYLNRNIKAIRYSVILGSLIPLVIYLLWEFVALGIIPQSGTNSFETLIAHHDNGTGVAQSLKHIVGIPWITEASRWFAIFAILTSLLGVSLALFHFLADAIGMKRALKRHRVLLLVGTYVPPFVVMVFYPAGFSRILSFAGIFVSILLGILPAVMAGYFRYFVKEKPSSYAVKGGKFVLILVILFFGYVTYLEIVNCLACQ